MTEGEAVFFAVKVNGQPQPTLMWYCSICVECKHVFVFVCVCVCVHVNITVFFALPPCCVDESYSHVCVPKMYWWMIM